MPSPISTDPARMTEDGAPLNGRREPTKHQSLAWYALLAATIVWTIFAAALAVLTYSFEGAAMLSFWLFWVLVISPPALWVVCIYVAKRGSR